MGSTQIFIIIIAALVITGTIAIVHASKDSKEIASLKLQMAKSDEDISSANAAISHKANQIIQLEKNNTALNNNLSNMTSAYYNLLNIYKGSVTEPTLKQFKNFADNYHDNTAYNENNYNCVEFVNSFIKKFKSAGYFGCNAVLTFNNSLSGEHDIVAVQTSDGLYYFEPQDETYFSSSKLDIGTDYCNLIDCDWNASYITKISSCFGEKH